MPWERRDELGLFKAYWDTARAAAFSPQIAFAGLEPRGRWWDAMSFAMVSTLLSAGVLVLFYGGVVGVAMTFAPHELAPQGGHGKLIELAVGIGVVALMLVLLPVSAIVRVYVGAGIDHLALRLLGGGGAGFDATLRTYCYSMAPAFCGLVPGCGIYAWEIWRIVLVSIGYQRIHRMAGARAVAAVLVPYVLCCGGYFALLFGVGVLGSLGK